MKTSLQHCLEIYRENFAMDCTQRPLPFCVVRDVGTAQECLMGNFNSWSSAMAWVKRSYKGSSAHDYDIFEYTDSLELTQEWTK